MINEVKVTLWKFGFMGEKKCPICKGKLMPHGFEGHNRAYTCERKRCSFNDA